MGSLDHAAGHGPGGCCDCLDAVGYHEPGQLDHVVGTGAPGSGTVCGSCGGFLAQTVEESNIMESAQERLARLLQVIAVGGRVSEAVLTAAERAAEQERMVCDAQAA